MRPGRFGLVLMATVSLAISAVANPKDPPVPPGLDPGGVAVALIGPGIDYTDPKIAAHLARDGEGELIGYDLVGDDRRPAENAGERGISSTALARELLGASSGVTLAPFRISMSDRTTLVRAIGMMAETRAGIAVLISRDASEPDRQVLEEASKRFPDLLFIVPNLGLPLDANAPALVELPNLILTDALVPEGGMSWLASFRPRLGDIALTVTEQLDGHDVDCEQGCVTVETLILHEAAIALAARAAALVSKEPALKGTELKRRLMAGAIPWPKGSSGPRYGELP